MYCIIYLRCFVYKGVSKVVRYSIINGCNCECLYLIGVLICELFILNGLLFWNFAIFTISYGAKEEDRNKW